MALISANTSVGADGTRQTFFLLLSCFLKYIPVQKPLEKSPRQNSDLFNIVE
jgi:hypothetical protein